MRSFLISCLVLCLPLSMVAATSVIAQTAGHTASAPPGDLLEDRVAVAPVVLDGAVLFRVRGISAFPANYRAKQTLERIIQVARNTEIDPTSGRIVTVEDRIALDFGDIRAVILYPVDAELEHVPLRLLAENTLHRLSYAIGLYREERTPTHLLRSTGFLAGITLLGALLLWACIALLGWFNRLIERKVKGHIQRLEQASHSILNGGQLWSWVGALVSGARALLLIAIVLTWANTALGLYPWTRPFAAGVFQLLLEPLRNMGTGIVNFLPDLAFLVVLSVIVRFILQATRTFFERVDRGWISLESFERDWAMPTFRIVRILIVAFALVVAYPYIPGSGSEAFKGLSIFMGVVLSIGSSSFIANMIAGYSLTYRAAYREGDRVKIGEHIGEVIEMRALSTRLRSLKNEDINIPNSFVLGSSVVNYTSNQAQEGLILHTDVGIGYDVPWRQVEAMLLQAAERTEGLLREPAPFVLQRSLEDFTVIYQLNAYCRDADRMFAIYSALHANIQDVFNEYGVQIMSPHYEVDPDEPKVVPPEGLYSAPAKPPTA
jgi:small-conductance mechanosensitive channel